MNWLQKLLGVKEFNVSCEILTDKDEMFSLTLPVSVPKSFFNITDESVIMFAVKNILFVKKGIIVKEIRITDCHLK
jgi:hypothetical protein